MTVLTVLTPGAATAVDADLVDDLALVAPAALVTALGWELKPEGLCREDLCVPVGADAALRHGERVDLVAAARLLGSSTLLADDAPVLAVSVPANERQRGLRGRVAPDFTLDDLDGESHRLAQYGDRKRLLVAFASW